MAELSVAQLYRLRQSRAYRQRRIAYQGTRPTPVAIGERRRPEPNGRPGYLRVDTVHQGDLDGVKGVYHLNAVDEFTQWQVLDAVPQISESWLKPALEAMLAQFPFHIRGFHSDNGLAEAKNGAVVRKHMGYTHIAAPHAAAIEAFYEEHFNPYLDLHRPCGVPELVVNGKGKEKRVYRWYATPWEILRHLPGLAGLTDPRTFRQSARRRSRTVPQPGPELLELRQWSAAAAVFWSGVRTAESRRNVTPRERPSRRVRSLRRNRHRGR